MVCNVQSNQTLANNDLRIKCGLKIVVPKNISQFKSNQIGLVKIYKKKLVKLVRCLKTECFLPTYTAYTIAKLVVPLLYYYVILKQFL